MSGKTLSNGTLGLRFMQNAQRAKQLKEVELQRAEVADEGKWEISPAVKNEWGLGRGVSEEQSTDVHEASYLPFLYSRGGDEDSPENVTRRIPNLGRRFFNRQDEDKDKPPVAPTSESATTSAVPSNSNKGRIRAHPHPISISTLNPGRGSLLKGFDQLSEDDRRKKRRTNDNRNDPHDSKATARQAVFEGGNVGVDLRAQGSTSIPTKAFIKPAGIDDPKDVAPLASSTKKAESRDEIIDGARQKLKNTKREREFRRGVADDDIKKPKKKKRSLESED